MSEPLDGILETVISLAIGLTMGLITYRVAKRKQLPRPVVWGVLAGGFCLPMITVLSAPDRGARDALKPWRLIARIVLTALGLGALLSLDDGHFTSRWLGSVYAGTFHLLDSGSVAHIEGNLIEFSFAYTEIVSSWANLVAFGAIGFVLGTAFWRPSPSILLTLGVLGCLFGAVYDYLRWALWFIAVSSATDDRTLLDVPNTSIPLLQTISILLVAATIFLATRKARHDNASIASLNERNLQY